MTILRVGELLKSFYRRQGLESTNQATSLFYLSHRNRFPPNVLYSDCVACVKDLLLSEWLTSELRRKPQTVQK
uniref:Uncharacterized protein n=1 Tax=Onchocerca volvulus TaxID=6282 RepID=A0A8R1Y2V3_ONCVO